MIFDEKFWLAFSFIILILVIYKPIKNFFIKFLDERAFKIKKELTESKSLENDANELLKEYQQKMSNSERDAEEIINTAKEEVNILKEKSKSDLNIYLNKKTSQIMEKIASRERYVLNELRTEILSLSIIIAERLIKENISDELQNKLKTNTISNISNKIH